MIPPVTGYIPQCLLQLREFPLEPIKRERQTYLYVKSKLKAWTCTCHHDPRCLIDSYTLIPSQRWEDTWKRFWLSLVPERETQKLNTGWATDSVALEKECTGEQKTIQAAQRHGRLAGLIRVSRNSPLARKRRYTYLGLQGVTGFLQWGMRRLWSVVSPAYSGSFLWRKEWVNDSRVHEEDGLTI